MHHRVIFFLKRTPVVILNPRSHLIQHLFGTCQAIRREIVQVILIDMVFSLDSVITAVGLAKDLWVMIAAIVVAIVIMMVFAGVIANFISHHPTLKMLALAFLILVGVMLVADGFGRHIERGYIYFAMAFSLTVEVLNIRVRTKRQAQG